MYIYHANGYVVRQDKSVKGEKVWEESSRFCDVFNDFEKAKSFLVDMFNNRIKCIYYQDTLFGKVDPEKGDFFKANESWQKEYIAEYIDYELTIERIDTHLWWKKDDGNHSVLNPPKTVYKLRYNGEVRTRFLHYNDGTSYENREEDAVAEAGTKFNVGDIVICSDWELANDFKQIMVMTGIPEKPDNATAPWNNLYYVGYFVYAYPNTVFCEIETLHEADLQLCPVDRLYGDRYREQLLSLQKVARGEIVLPDNIMKDFIYSRINFSNEGRSWRDIAEFHKG